MKRGDLVKLTWKNAEANLPLNARTEFVGVLLGCFKTIGGDTVYNVNTCSPGPRWLGDGDRGTFTANFWNIEVVNAV
tara:strand:+ start:791 stop:1021 length:231 start_codon:yes stop_codon:yes gene_type:complete